jgi:hypothetical protein
MQRGAVSAGDRIFMLCVCSSFSTVDFLGRKGVIGVYMDKLPVLKNKFLMCEHTKFTKLIQQVISIIKRGFLSYRQVPFERGLQMETLKMSNIFLWYIVSFFLSHCRIHLQ